MPRADFALHDNGINHGRHGVLRSTPPLPRVYRGGTRSTARSWAEDGCCFHDPTYDSVVGICFRLGRGASSARRRGDTMAARSFPRSGGAGSARARRGAAMAVSLSPGGVMRDRSERRRKPEDVGGESPVTEEVKEQRVSGLSGGPRARRQAPKVPPQPPQESGRRPVRHEHVPTARKSFSEEERPSAQGDGPPDPESLKRRSSLRGIEPRSGSHGSHGERTEEEARRGAPRLGDSAWRGRQGAPGKVPDGSEDRARE